jgi:hypothetical protein
MSPCRIVEVYRLSGGIYCLHLQVSTRLHGIVSQKTVSSSHSYGRRNIKPHSASSYIKQRRYKPAVATVDTDVCCPTTVLVLLTFESMPISYSKLTPRKLVYLYCKDSVGIATGYGMDGRGVGVRVPVGARSFSSPRHPDRFWGPPSLLSNGYRGPFPRTKRPGCEADHSLSTSAEVKNTWIYTSTPSYVFMA